MSEGRRPRGVTPHPRTGAAAKSARLQWCRNDREELPHVRVLGGRPRGAIPHPRPGWRPGGATLCPRPGVVARRSHTTSKKLWLCGHRRAYTSYPTLKVRKGGGKEIPLVQAKGQRLCFAGAPMKRYPTPR